MDYRIFNVCTDVNACDCIGGCTDTIRESALKVDSGRKIPCHIWESNLRQWRAGLMLYQLSYIPTLWTETGNSRSPFVHQHTHLPVVLVAATPPHPVLLAGELSVLHTHTQTCQYYMQLEKACTDSNTWSKLIWSWKQNKQQTWKFTVMKTLCIVLQDVSLLACKL